jgi:hypothetical protein
MKRVVLTTVIVALVGGPWTLASVSAESCEEGRFRIENRTQSAIQVWAPEFNVFGQTTWRSITTVYPNGWVVIPGVRNGTKLRIGTRIYDVRFGPSPDCLQTESVLP